MKSTEQKLEELAYMEFIIETDGWNYESGIEGVLSELVEMNKSNWGKTVVISLWKDHRPVMGDK